MRKQFRVLEKAVLVTIGVLGLVFIFSRDSAVTQTDEPLAGTIQPVTVNNNSTQRQNITPVCRPDNNISQAPAFAEQPPHIKDFLRHKHCRDFGLLQNVPGKCGGPDKSGDVFLLLVIKSSPLNHDRREMVRRTWGKERRHLGAQIKRVFITAVSPDLQSRRKLNRLLDMENQEHQDILQWDFYDTFFNLTLKQYKLMQWLDEYCPGAQFIFNGDDDVFAHTDNMVEYLQSQNAAKHLYVGYLISGVGPIREKWSKYYVSPLVFASNSYPAYVAGGGILMSRFTAIAIYRSAHQLDFLPIDDVYFGMCLQKAGLAPSFHMGFWVNGVKAPSPQEDSFNPCYYREVLIVHRFLPYELLLMWEAVHNSSLKCARAPQ